MKMTPFEVFYCYSNLDETLRDELEKHLSSLRREGRITNWHFRKITGGREWEGEIDEHLNTSRIIMMLVSSDFLSSDYCYDVEMKKALELHHVGKARVIPVILRPVDWGSSPLGKLQALPKNAKPVTKWTNRDEAFTNIALGIRQICEELQGTSEQHLSRPVANTPKNVKQRELFCSRCGMRAGVQSVCSGLQTAHTFKSYVGQPYCARCGVKAGEKTTCSGLQTAHTFKSYVGQPYCARCGVKAGEKTICSGLQTAHTFESYVGQPYCARCGVKAGEKTICTGFQTAHTFVSSSQP